MSNFPAYLQCKPVQDWLTVRQMQVFLESGQLPDHLLFTVRMGVELAAELPGFSSGEMEYVERAKLPQLWSFDSVLTFLECGALPVDFRERLQRIYDQEKDLCRNCDGRRCMGCVFREYDHVCSERRCPDC